MAYYLTADGGTESLRARIYDLTGHCLGQMAVPYDTHFAPGARAEQNPEDWWQALVTASAGAIAQAGIDGAQVEAMCLATTCCTVVALDEAGRALRPALLWMDVRANAEADLIEALEVAVEMGGGPAVMYSGKALAAFRALA